jgi:hypothetical protein
MSLFLGFAPFIVFAILMRLSVELALWIAFAVAFTIGIRGFVRTRSLRILDVGATAVFGFLALFCGFIETDLDGAAIRLVIDLTLVGIALASLAARQPFTMQYAREEVPPEVFSSTAFVRANYVVTLVWMTAFALMSAADAAAAFDPKVTLTEAVAAGLVALAGAVAFTWRYPAQLYQKGDANRVGDAFPRSDPPR